ncbi:acetate kinase [Rhodoglobus aureus]|uniref:Acetate kinase n=1 Tax=Rhodoglobus aureus TaxID=191497 RepID=A0ABN1VYB7_9MICO
MTTVFVVNSGSSSIKWELLDAESGSVYNGGIVERIGEPGGGAEDHDDGMQQILAKLGDEHPAVVGHRVVHGGAEFTQATVITDEVEHRLDEISVLAPLHNPENLKGIRAARAAFGDVPHVAVFDTAFHGTLPPEAYTYAIDADVAREHGIRRYGFHGTSYRYVAGKTAELLGRELSNLKLIVFHLGNGASVCAIDGGRSIDTSMGMTPLEGLVMGTRSGDIDPGALFHLGRAGMTLPELDQLLNRRSGLLGMTGTGDMRDVHSAADAGDENAKAALAVYYHRLRHYLGAYLVALGGADAIVFTAGVGENNAATRRETVTGLDGFGIELDAAANASSDRGARDISTPASATKVLVVPTNEELQIAREAVAAASL